MVRKLVKVIVSASVVAAGVAIATPSAEAAQPMTEFCVQNSPDGELLLRATPAMTSYAYEVLYNGECGIFIAPNPGRAGAFVRATVNGRRGWVKSKWIVRIDKANEDAGC